MPIHPDFQKIYNSFIKRYKGQGKEYYYRWVNKNKLDDTKPMPKHLSLASVEAEIMSFEAYTEPVRFRDKLAMELFNKKFDELSDEQKNRVHEESIKRRGKVAKPSASLEAAKWSRKFMNDLPDSAFAWIQPGGKKNGDDKTVPRSYRHLPYKDSSGNVDLPHLRNAIARLGQGKPFVMPVNLRKSAQGRLQSILVRMTK